MANVLLLSAGRRVSLLRAFEEAMETLGLEGDVIAADMAPARSAACQTARRFVTLPHVMSPEYAEALRSVCEAFDVTVVIPTIDTELRVLADLRESFALSGVRLVVSSAELVGRCRDKRLTSRLFAEIGISTPRAYSPDALVFPCFSKPISGSLSQGIRVFESAAELETSSVDRDATLFMEIVSGPDWEEVSIDVFYSREGALCCLVPRRRTEVRGGEISKGWTDKSLICRLRPALEQLVGAQGCLTVQVFAHRTSQALLGIEINPRFGGGYPLAHKAGGRYAEWILRETLLGDTLQYTESWTDRLMMLRYDAEVWTLLEPA